MKRGEKRKGVGTVFADEDVEKTEFRLRAGEESER